LPHDRHDTRGWLVGAIVRVPIFEVICGADALGKFGALVVGLDRFFQHQGDEMVYVLSGQVEIHLDSEKIRLAPGDCIYFDANIPHRSRSIGRERAQTLVVVDASS
jgi:Cupin domain